MFTVVRIAPCDKCKRTSCRTLSDAADASVALSFGFASMQQPPFSPDINVNDQYGTGPAASWGCAATTAVASSAASAGASDVQVPRRGPEAPREGRGGGDGE